MEVIEINENEFDEKVLKSDKKVLVDFYANWCGPCKMLSPVISEVAKEDDTYNYYKIDVDKAESISKRYGIMSIPALFIFENGEVSSSNVGFMSKDELKKYLGI